MTARHDAVNMPLQNMPSTKKRARSPEGSGPSSTRQKTSNSNYQEPRPKKRRWRKPKDERIKALQKAESKRRSTVYWPSSYQLPTASDRELDTRAHRTAPAPVESSPEPVVPHSPPLLPEGGDEYDHDIFNGSPVPSHIPIGSGLRTTSRRPENRSLLRQTRHLDNHTSAWKRRRDKQAMEWKSVAIP